MSKKNLFILISASVLIIGTAMLAGAEEKGKTIRSQELVKSTELHEVQANAGDPAEKDAGDHTRVRDRTQTRDRFRDGTGHHDPDHDQDHDRIYDHQGMGGCMGGDCMGSGGMGAGGMGAGGMGGGMRGPRR